MAYPDILLQKLASGVGIVGINPLLVGQEGTSYIYEDTDTPINTYNLCLSNKAIKGLQCVRSTDGVWGTPITDTSIGIDNMPNSTQWLEEIMLFSYTSKNNSYIQTPPKPVIEVEPKVTASNSHSIYKGALIGNQVSGKIQVGGAHESRVLENVLSGGYDVLVTAGVPFDIVTGKVYAFQGFDNEAVNVVLRYRNGISASNVTYTSNAVSPLGDASWTVVCANRYIGTPQHSTIALDNSNSPASKWFTVLEEGANGVVAGVYGEELVYNTITSSYDGDDDTFEQLTNGTITDLNGNTARTFHGSIPINGKVK